MPEGRDSVVLRAYRMNASYELIYFNARGRAEVARYLFALARVPYADVRIETDQWSDLKESTPFGQLPVLRVNGVQYCRSEAIFRFLAREFGFYGQSEEDGAEIDMAVHRVLRVFNEIVPVWQGVRGEHRSREQVRIATESVPELVGFLDARLSDRSWLVGDSISLADVVAYMFFTTPITNEFLGQWTKWSGAVATLVRRISVLPAIVAYESLRPPTEF